jgi:hypothetical protein
MNAPCPTCPWRRDSLGGVAIPGFDICKARNLACTVGEGDGFRTVMACHGSGEGSEIPCAGYLAIEGYSNLNVRIMAMDGRIDLQAIDEACADLDLFDNFEDMLDALEAKEI